MAAPIALVRLLGSAVAAQMYSLSKVVGSSSDDGVRGAFVDSLADSLASKFVEDFRNQLSSAELGLRNNSNFSVLVLNKPREAFQSATLADKLAIERSNITLGAAHTRKVGVKAYKIYFPKESDRKRLMYHARRDRFQYHDSDARRRRWAWLNHKAEEAGYAGGTRNKALHSPGHKELSIKVWRRTPFANAARIFAAQYDRRKVSGFTIRVDRTRVRRMELYITVI